MSNSIVFILTVNIGLAWFLSTLVVLAGDFAILSTSIFLQYTTVIFLIAIFFKKWEQ